MPSNFEWDEANKQLTSDHVFDLDSDLVESENMMDEEKK